jgi:hypothetical protein
MEAPKRKAQGETRVSSALKIRYPLIPGPLGGLSSQRFTAAVSNLGGLGSFGAHGLLWRAWAPLARMGSDQKTSPT